MIVTLNQFGTA